jgi:hypothetical protein
LPQPHLFSHDYPIEQKPLLRELFWARRAVSSQQPAASSQIELNNSSSLAGWAGVAYLDFDGLEQARNVDSVMRDKNVLE